MTKRSHIAAPVAVAAFALALCGCTGEGDLIDVIGSSVDPYAANVAAMNAQQQEASQAAQEAAEQQAQEQETTTSQPEIEQQAEEEQEQQPEEQVEEEQPVETDTSGDHYEGEYATLNGPGGSFSVYATWTHDYNGAWTATFYTYNGTQLNAYPSGDTWRFFTTSGREVVPSDSSANYGMVGPAGIESYWRDAADGSIWY